MVKRHNKTGRRQILQLEDKKPPPQTAVASSYKAHTSRSLTYYSDSDDESKSNPCEAEASVPSASETSSTTGPIDSQVADFLKEIDALSVTENSETVSSEADPKPLVVEGTADDPDVKLSANTCQLPGAESSEHSSGVINGGTDVSKQEVYCVWQQCHDESSGYSYYWNVMTNEVTWDCPPEYVAYQKYLNSTVDVAAAQSSQPSISGKSKSIAKKSQKKHEAVLKEGAIIPISYFGGSSSSESSDEADSQCSPDSPVSERNPSQSCRSLSYSKHKNQLKSKTSKKGHAEAMGPQLPPNFQFPEDVPLSPSQSSPNDGSLKIGTSPTVVIGPQLPPGYSHEGVILIKDVDENQVKIENIVNESQCSDLQSSSHVSTVVDSSGSEDKLDMEKQFQSASKCSSPHDQSANNASDVPDSTTRKETPPPKSTADESVEVNTVVGYRPVVEYDSFSDTEEEMDITCSSSSKPLSVGKTHMSLNSSDAVSESFQHVTSDQNSPIDGTEFECSTSSEIAVKDYEDECSSNVQTLENLPESLNEGLVHIGDVSAYSSYENENLADDEVIRPKKTYSDIVNNMFSFAKETEGKFGFGFSKSKQLELENEAFDMSEHGYTGKRHGKNYPIISFVKSKQILDLNTLNESHTCKVKEACEKEISPSVKKDPVAISCSSKMAENCDLNIELETKPQVSVSEPSEQHNSEYQTLNKPVKSMEKSLIPEEQQAVSAVKKEDSKKSKVKKKHASKVKKEAKLVELPSSTPGQDTSTSEVNGGVDDIDQLLGNILKEMVQSGDTVSTQSTESQKSLQEVKKRRHLVPTHSPVKKKKKEEVKEPEEKSNDDVMSHIIDLSTVLMEKMTFLVTNHSTMVSLSSVLVQIQTRLVDWQAGALDSKYFMDRLQEVQQYLQHYEMGAVSGDWTCQWDRENKRYFYVNERTQHSQWTYPSETVAPSSMHNKGMWNNPSSEIPMTSNSNFRTSGTQFPLVSSSMSEEQGHKTSAGSSNAFAVQKEDCDHENKERCPHSNSNWLHQLVHEPSPPPPPPGVDTPPPPPPPPMTPPPESPPPPPPDSTEVEEGEIPDVDMDLEDSNSLDSITFARNATVKDVVEESEQPSQVPIKHFFVECSSTRSPEQQPTTFSLSIVSSTSVGHSESAVIAKPPQPITLSSGSSSFSTASAVNIQPTWAMSSSVPSCSSSQNNYVPANNEIAAPPICMPSSQKFSADDIGKTSPADECSSPTCSSHLPSNKTAVSTSNISTTVNKKDKKKPKLRTGLSFKKKNIPSLVQKWQKIKEEQEKEDKNSDDPKISTSMK